MNLSPADDVGECAEVNILHKEVGVLQLAPVVCTDPDILLRECDLTGETA